MRSDYEAVISIGSNSPAARERVTDAIRFLRSLLLDCSASEAYTTPAMGRFPAPPYTNAVVRGTAFYPPAVLASILKAYELSQGRSPGKNPGGIVVIDLDLVTADGTVLRERDFNAPYFIKGYREINSQP